MNDSDKRARLREILADPSGALAPGVTDALTARLVEDCGYAVAHLSGNSIHKNFCLPDRNLLDAAQIAERAEEISAAGDIPLIVDAGPVCIEAGALAHAVVLYERAGAAAIRFEDSLTNEYGAAKRELAVAPAALVVERIKAAADARRDRALLLIARCDARPRESLAQVCERLAAYVDAGADAIGVQLDDAAEFRTIAANPPAPVITLWPRTEIKAGEFLRLGVRIALLPSSLPVAAATAMRELLLELQRGGSDREYFARQKEFAATEIWYKRLGAHRPD
jgi:2-methylisocitrate lyase-like PEP mutase family enzyme